MAIKGKTALVTGATSGIGKACACRLAEAGCNLILCGRRLDLLNRIGDELGNKYKVEVHALPLDVRDRYAVESMPDSIPENFGAATILINNAGLALGFEKLESGDPDDWDTMIDTNVKGLLYVTRTFLKRLDVNAEAHIVNIGSIAGINAYPNGAVYCATKAAVRFISDAVRMETVERPVRVTNIQPGLVETEFSIVRFHGDKERAGKVYEGIIPLSGEDIADAVMYALSVPGHVQIAEITITATHQANATNVFRKTS
jgi:3-hydroxy acid dehydrogenase/malonic semialdehyde reductase